MSSIAHLEPQVTAIPAAHRWALARWIGYFALIDLLMLPYFQLVIVPLSLPVVLFAMLLLNTTLKRDLYLLLFLMLILCVALGAGIGFFITESQDYFPENVKRLIQLFTSFAYFFYFRWLAERTPLRIAPIIYLFLSWFSALAVAFYFTPDLTGDLMRTFYGRLVTSEETLTEHLRFAYLFTDPNTAAYFLLVAASVLFMQQRSALRLLLFVALLTPLVFVTQSRGALICLGLMIAVTIYPPHRLRALLSVRKAAVLALIAIALYGLFVYVKTSAEDATGLVKLAYERFFVDPEQYSTAGSRVDVWKRFIGNLIAFPFGRGYVLMVDGTVQGTHSDLLRLAYSYGTIAAVTAVGFFFRRAMTLTPLIIPALTAFLINSLIDEQKLLGLFLALLAIGIVAEERYGVRT